MGNFKVFQKQNINKENCVFHGSKIRFRIHSIIINDQMQPQCAAVAVVIPYVYRVI